MKGEAVSVIIPTKNAERYLEEQLKAIFSQEDVPRPEVVIIDSGSTDRTLHIASRHPAKPAWERFPFRDVDFGEDVDWAERVLLAGYKIVYEPKSRAVTLLRHTRGYTSEMSPATRCNI